MENIIECPVCGMEFPQQQAGATAVQGAQTFFFCCTGCRDAFLADPGRTVLLVLTGIITGFVAPGCRVVAGTDAG